MPFAYLAGSFVGAHLQTNRGLVKGFVGLHLGVIKMPPGPIGCHTRLAGTFVGSHLSSEKISVDYQRSVTDTQYNEGT